MSASTKNDPAAADRSHRRAKSYAGLSFDAGGNRRYAHAVADDLASVRLILATLRAERVPFADAWAVAFPEPRPHRERDVLRAALDETADAWQRAYSNAPPTAGERAAARVSALWNDRADDAEDRGEL